jgi:hypothetical protein
MRAKRVLFNLALLCLPLGAAFAHHSYAHFDMTKSLVIDGLVSEVQYQNPHTWLFVDVRNAAGKVETWAIEAGGPNILMRQGWKANTVKVGDKVSALIHPGRDPTQKSGSLTALKLPDGRTIGTWE